MNTGIWKYADKFEPEVDDQHRLSIGEGDTPLEKINIKDSLQIWVKREDHNPTGSHKDRGLAYQISKHLQDGITKFALSSSGNSSISAVRLLLNRSETLNIFVPELLSESKINRLAKEIGTVFELTASTEETEGNITVKFSKRPASDAFKFAQSENAVLLRGSTDPVGPEGYKTIAFEIDEEIGDIDAIFIPTSSATSAVGIHKGFAQLGKSPKINIVQTSKVNPIARDFDKDFQQSEESLADSIVDRVAHRRDEIKNIIKQLDGNAWVANDREIENANKILQKNGLEVSNDAALSIAGAIKALSKGAISADQKIVCVLTGKK